MIPMGDISMQRMRNDRTERIDAADNLTGRNGRAPTTAEMARTALFAVERRWSALTAVLFTALLFGVAPHPPGWRPSRAEIPVLLCHRPDLFNVGLSHAIDSARDSRPCHRAVRILPRDLAA